MALDQFRCLTCRFCEEMELDKELIRCSNADVASEAGWEELYYTQGYLDLTIPTHGDQPCFWFVPKS